MADNVQQDSIILVVCNVNSQQKKAPKLGSGLAVWSFHVLHKQAFSGVRQRAPVMQKLSS